MIRIGVAGHLMQSAEVDLVPKHFVRFAIVDGSKRILRIAIAVVRWLIRPLLLDQVVHGSGADGSHGDASLAHLGILVLMDLVLIRCDFGSERVRVLFEDQRNSFGPDVLVVAIVLAIRTVAI